MSNQVQTSHGAPPWLPTRDTQQVETLHYYDGPLLGIFRQYGVPYLYRCLVGQLGSEQMWLYVPLTEDEVAALQNTEGDSLDELVDELSVNRQLTVALADTAEGVLYAEAQDTYGLDPDELALVMVRRLQESLKRMSDRTEDLVKSV